MIFNKVRKNVGIPVPDGKALFFIGINLLLTLSLFVVNIIAGERIGYSSMVVLFNTFVFVAFFIVTTWTIIRTVQIYRREADMQSKQAAFQALQQYTGQLETLYNNLRSFKHDYVNIITTMYGYIDTNDIQGLSDYFNDHILPLTKQLAPENHQISRLANLKIVELKGLVTAKIIYAQEMNIRTTIEIDTPIENINMDIVDLARITGIFLDNAIEAALETVTPKISFIVIREPDEIVIMIANTFIDHNIPMSDLSKPEVSSKGENRGVGLYNVHQMLSNYKNLYLDTRVENGMFIQVMHIYSVLS